MPVDELWYRTDSAARRAEREYYRLVSSYESFLEFEQHRSVSRGRFRTLTDRVERTGAPFGAHTLVYRPDGSILLVRHRGVGRWVLPGGEVDDTESYEDTAERELKEEAGIDAEYRGLALVSRVTFSWEQYETWGVVPVFEARARSTTPRIADPDDEISAADWFGDLPEDTREKQWIRRWRDSCRNREVGGAD
ncbi:MAG: NUDIX hydrolase [Halodesulfurarchaeum sp.]